MSTAETKRPTEGLLAIYDKPNAPFELRMFPIRDPRPGEVLVKIDPRYFRPTEVDLLLGDASKAKARLGWTPTATLEDLVREMMESDLALMSPGRRGA